MSMYSDDDENLTSDEDFQELVYKIAFPRRKKKFRHRIDHFVEWNEQEFLDRFRLSKSTVMYLVEKLKSKISSRTTRNNALTAREKVLLTLRYYATGSMIKVAADFVGVHESTASRVIRLVSYYLARLRPEFIEYPTSEEELSEIRQGFFNIAQFPRCIGAVDCTHVKILSPGGQDAEIFRNRKRFFSYNVQAVCDSNLRFLNVVCRWPGSSHDSTIFNNSSIKYKFEDGEFGNDLLVGDGGYGVRNYLITPLRNPITAAEKKFNFAQIRTRNPIERTFGVWKRRFPILAVGINLEVTSVEMVVTATAVLHNIARFFGDAMPAVERGIERLVDLTEFDAEEFAVPPINVNQIQRDTLINYFDAL
ncbi:putative nuclease HARBI1 [Planococcus citri]|uniref:putative nuclease HARBI1 n=1 Tax=Planococcus citri TaxID=170843 RepID=UPI0031F92148